jgi:hypothetical protein
MGAGAIDSPHDDEGEARATPRKGTGSPTTAVGHETHKLTYQVIRRHLTKFRDGAHAILDIFAGQPNEPASTCEGEPSPPGTVETEPEASLKVRIEQHMARVDRALIELRTLSSDLEKKLELAPQMRDQILTKERTIHDIVGAELHFWAAAIENAPLDEFDEIEQKWVRLIIRLATVIGVDAEHKEHLDFLEDWASQERP